jgi:hypothetical protein
VSARVLSLVVTAGGASVSIIGMTVLWGPKALVGGGLVVAAYGLFGIDIAENS